MRVKLMKSDWPWYVYESYKIEMLTNKNLQKKFNDGAISLFWHLYDQ